MHKVVGYLWKINSQMSFRLRSGLFEVYFILEISYGCYTQL